ncbi:2648_t:CDS:2 [Entrophospora sp. SA101]|nr:2641_t:CDS:2 [Entrophospora sp. SA101]CAJ0651010.1 2648_t:CDS:2 [Entrophospora sp. SA101]CAJ0842428.1 4420_t:CDS:2 [Entrophospora sp. SA101]
MRENPNEEFGSRIKIIRFGEWEMDTWFASPYPEEHTFNPSLRVRLNRSNEDNNVKKIGRKPGAKTEDKNSYNPVSWKS